MFQMSFNITKRLIWGPRNFDSGINRIYFRVNEWIESIWCILENEKNSYFDRNKYQFIWLQNYIHFFCHISHTSSGILKHETSVWNWILWVDQIITFDHYVMKTKPSRSRITSFSHIHEALENMQIVKCKFRNLRIFSAELAISIKKCLKTFLITYFT